MSSLIHTPVASLIKKLVVVRMYKPIREMIYWNFGQLLQLRVYTFFQHSLRSAALFNLFDGYQQTATYCEQADSSKNRNTRREGCKRKVRSIEQIWPFTSSGAVWIWLSELQDVVDTRVSIGRCTSDTKPIDSQTFDCSRHTHDEVGISSEILKKPPDNRNRTEKGPSILTTLNGPFRYTTFDGLRVWHAFCLKARHETSVDLVGREELDRMPPDEKDQFVISSNTWDGKPLTAMFAQFGPTFI
ncbi:hypothetical protein KCV06_g62, partial [Aureobasidium melanogenum]